MKKLDEIKAFIQKNATVMAELEQFVQRDSLYSLCLSEDIIEKQQELIRHARRIGVLSVDQPSFEGAEFNVLIRFKEFCSFIDLDECKEAIYEMEDKTAYIYSIIIDNIVLKAIKHVPNEEHKKAQAI